MAPGDRVVFHGRKGTVEAVQPGGMVDVRFDDAPHRVERRSADRLRSDRARSNPMSEEEARQYWKTQRGRIARAEERAARKKKIDVPPSAEWHSRGANIFTRPDPPRLSADKKMMCGNPLDGIGYYIIVSDIGKWREEYVTMRDFEAWKSDRLREFQQDLEAIREQNESNAALNLPLVEEPASPDTSESKFIESLGYKAKRVSAQEIERSVIRQRQRSSQRESAARGRETQLVGGRRRDYEQPPQDAFRVGVAPNFSYFLEGGRRRYAQERLAEQFSPYAGFRFTATNVADNPTVADQLAARGVNRGLIEKIIACGMVQEGSPARIVILGDEAVYEGQPIQVRAGDKSYSPFFSWVRTVLPVETAETRCLGEDDELFRQKLTKGSQTMRSLREAFSGIASMFLLGKREEERLPLSVQEILKVVARLSESLANQASWWEYIKQAQETEIPSEQKIKFALLRVQAAVERSFPSSAGRPSGWGMMGELSKRAGDLHFLQAVSLLFPRRTKEEAEPSSLGRDFFRGALSYPGLIGKSRYAGRASAEKGEKADDVGRWLDAIKFALAHEQRGPAVRWECTTCGFEWPTASNAPRPEVPCPSCNAPLGPETYMAVRAPPGWADRLRGSDLWGPFILSLGVKFGPPGSQEQLYPSFDLSPVAGVLDRLAKADAEKEKWGRQPDTAALRKIFAERWGGRRIWTALRGGVGLKGPAWEHAEDEKAQVIEDLRRLEDAVNNFLEEKPLYAAAEGPERSVLLFRLLGMYARLAEEEVPRDEADQIIVWMALLGHIYRWLFGAELMGQLFPTKVEVSRGEVPLQFGRWGDKPGDDAFASLARELEKSQRALSFSKDLSQYEIDPSLMKEGAVGSGRAGAQTVYYTYNPALYRATLMFWPSRAEEGGGWRGFLKEDPAILQHIDNIGTYGVALDVVRSAALRADLEGIAPGEVGKRVGRVLSDMLARRGLSQILPKYSKDDPYGWLQNTPSLRILLSSPYPDQRKYALDTLKDRFGIVAFNIPIGGFRPYTITNLLRPLGKTFEEGLDLMIKLRTEPLATLEEMRKEYARGIVTTSTLDWGFLSQARSGRSWPADPTADPKSLRLSPEGAAFFASLWQGEATLEVKEYPPGPEREVVRLLAGWLAAITSEFMPQSLKDHRRVLANHVAGGQPVYTQAIVRDLYQRNAAYQQSHAGQVAESPPLPYLSSGRGESDPSGLEPAGSAFDRISSEQERRERLRMAIRELRRFLS